MNLAAALGPQSETRVVTCSRAIMMAVWGLGGPRATSDLSQGPSAPRPPHGQPGGQRPTPSPQTLSQDLGQRNRERETERQRQRDVYLLKKCELLHCKFTSARSVNNKR